MELNLNLNPVDIEKAVTEAVVQGVLGDHLKAAVNAALTPSPPSFGKTSRSVVQTAVDKAVHDKVKEITTQLLLQREAELRELVAAKLTREALERTIEKIWSFTQRDC